MNSICENSDLFPITRMWSSVDTTCLERFQLTRSERNWKLQGTILRLHAGQPIEARYEVECNSHWQTLMAQVELDTKTEKRSMTLRNHDGLWTLNGKAVPVFDGCMDVDLGWTPSTNTLPIRRLHLARSDIRQPVDAVWIRFPDLGLERLHQLYEPTGDKTYRYIAAHGSLVAQITVDQFGIVDEYSGYWKRIA